MQTKIHTRQSKSAVPITADIYDTDQSIFLIRISEIFVGFYRQNSPHARIYPVENTWVRGKPIESMDFQTR